MGSLVGAVGGGTIVAAKIPGIKLSAAQKALLDVKDRQMQALFDEAVTEGIEKLRVQTRAKESFAAAASGRLSAPALVSLNRALSPAHLVLDDEDMEHETKDNTT